MRIFARNCLIALVDTCQVPVKWEVGESPPFVPVKEEGGIYLKICYIHVFQRFTSNNNN